MPSEPISLECLRERLDHVLQSHASIAESISYVAELTPGRSRLELRQLARFFARRPAAEEVLQHPAALSICLPLTTVRHPDAPRREQIEASLSGWLERDRELRWKSHRRTLAVLYPTIVVFVTFAVIGLICGWIVPQFEEMFRSFDLEVPALTSLLILLSHLVRDYGLIVASLIVLSGLAAWGGAWWQEKYGEGSWRSRLLARYRSDLESLADWASQVAALIDAGLSQPDAIRTAGDASEKQWLSDTSQAWSETVRGGGTPKDEFLYIRGRACHLLAYALQLPDAEQQSAMLGEVSRIYRGRDQQRSGWWIDWFAQASVVVVGVAVGFVVLALFLPLVSLVSGLT